MERITTKQARKSKFTGIQITDRKLQPFTIWRNGKILNFYSQNPITQPMKRL